jgi:hypothetical protein
MNILKLMAILRKQFQRLKVVEIPAFPTSIHENWCHPDIYINIKKNNQSSCFTFQNFKRSNSIWVDKAVKTPDLIWLTNIKAESNAFIEPIKNTLESFARELGFDGECQYFDFEYTQDRPLNRGETGCFWNILLAGVECGRLSVYSTLPGDLTVKEPCFILTLQLNKIINIYHRNSSASLLAWSDDMLVSDSMALIAWEELEKQRPCTVNQALDELAKASKNKNFKYLLCNIFELYNAYSEQLNKNAEAFQQFKGLFKTFIAEVVENEA